MSHRERIVIAAVLTFIALLVGVDIFTDSREGVLLWHMFVEGSLGAIALFGVFYLLRGSIQLKSRLVKSEQDLITLRSEAEGWRAEAKRFVDGLAKSIDQQLEKWALTAAEKEVAFLLLKGLSLKEIADVRRTSEKTARAQSTAIYLKSKLAGRSELSAFFLEDLLVPANQR